MSESEWTKILGWPGYRVYRSEINEAGKSLRLWVRRKRGNRKLECSGCGRRIQEVADVYEREVRDLPWSEYRATVGKSSSSFARAERISPPSAPLPTNCARG